MTRGIGLIGFAMALGLATALVPVAMAQTAADQQETVERVRTTIEEAKHDPQFGSSDALLRRAKAVLVVPQLVKGGLFFGGEGGTGVLIARRADGRWGDPAFYALGSASFGLQIGVEVSQVMMFIMSDRALQALEQSEVKLGAQAGLTVLVAGTAAQAAATTNGNVDIIAWAKGKGAYAGVTLEGSVVKPLQDWDTRYYGRPVSNAALISGVPIAGPGAASLRAVLSP